MTQDAAWDDLPLLFPSIEASPLPLATAAIVEEPTVDGTPDVHTALQDFHWFRGPSPRTRSATFGEAWTCPWLVPRNLQDS